MFGRCLKIETSAAKGVADLNNGAREFVVCTYAHLRACTQHNYAADLAMVDNWKD